MVLIFKGDGLGYLDMAPGWGQTPTSTWGKLVTFEPSIGIQATSVQATVFN